ncbi:IclR family transcriptional regulator [Aquabacterium sp.]|uniref:IclR family transcriptional regulator n=1 Tax=Aquabacterium sp. TaxID=1872578 RepID=UPI0037848BFA
MSSIDTLPGSAEPGGERGGDDRYTVPGLERGLRILCEFSRREPTLTAPELARRLGVPRSTVFRLLVTLEQMGFVERTADGRAHRLGLAVLRLGFEYMASLDIVALGRPLLERLRDDSGFAASLVVRDGRDIVYLQRAAPQSPFATTVTVGTRLPAHATVLGHVLLGDLSLSELRALYPEPRLDGASANTPANADALFEVVQQTRQRGYVMAEAFFEPHISTVAAPVFGDNGHVVAALGLTIPGGQIPAERQAPLVGQVRAAATHLSTLLNFQPEPADEAAPAAAPQRKR